MRVLGYVAATCAAAAALTIGTATPATADETDHEWVGVGLNADPSQAGQFLSDATSGNAGNWAPVNLGTGRNNDTTYVNLFQNKDTGETLFHSDIRLTLEQLTTPY